MKTKTNRVRNFIYSMRRNRSLLQKQLAVLLGQRQSNGLPLGPSEDPGSLLCGSAGGSNHEGYRPGVPRQRSDSARTIQTPSRTADRKPWKKKTPVEVVMDQEKKLREQIAEREGELKDLRRQLQKFEEARKIFETT